MASFPNPILDRMLSRPWARKIPGMERLGEPPGIPPLQLPPGLAAPTPTPEDVRAMIGNYGPVPTPQQVQKAVDLRETVGNLIPEGVAEIGAGVYDLPKAPVHGAGEIARGVMKAGMPAAAGALMATPVPVLAGMAVGTGVGYGSTKAALGLGFDPQTAQDVGDIAALLSGAGTGIAGMTRRLGVARTVADLNAKAEGLIAKIPNATPEQAGVLRAQVSALTKAASELAPPEPIASPTAVRPERRPSAPEPILEPKVEAIQERQLAAQPPVPEPVAPPEPVVTPIEAAQARIGAEQIAAQRTAPPAFPQAAERAVATERAGQLSEVVRQTEAGQRAAGIEPSAPVADKSAPAPLDFLTSEAGAINYSILGQKAKAGGKEFETKWLDRNAPLKYLNQQANVPFEKDPYIWAAGLESRVQGKWMEFERKLNAIEYPAVKAGTWGDTSKYMRDERIMAFLQEDPNYKIPSEKLPDGTLVKRTAQDIQAEMAAIQAKYGPQGMAKLTSDAQVVRDLQRQAYQEWEASGMEKAGTVQKKLSTPAGQKYISLGREKFLEPIEGQEVTQPKRGLSIPKREAVHKISEEGSELPLADETELIIRDTMRMFREAETNRVAQLQADLEFNPAFKGTIRKLKNARGPIPAEKPKSGEASFPVWRNGTKFQYAAPADVAKAMRGLSEQGIGFLETWGRRFNAGLRLGSTTYYLPFWATNIGRDFQTAYWRSPIGFSLYDWGKGFADAFKMGPEYVNFMKSGGGMSGFFSYDRGLGLKDVARRVQESPARRRAEDFLGPRLINPLRGMEYLANSIEMAPRIGLAQRAQKMGKSELYSGYLGRNITVDFNKMGTSMKWYNAVNWPFNAKVQASANFVQSLKNNPKTAFPKLATSVGIPIVAAWAWNTTQYPEVWDNIDQQTKNNYLVVIHGTGKSEDGRFNEVKLFRKPDAVQFFGNIIEGTLENVRGVNPKKAGQIALETTSAFSAVNFMERGRLSGRMALSDVVPMPLRVGPELWANQSLRMGIPIEQGNTPGGTWYNRYTNRTTQSLGGKLAIPLSRLTPGVSPQQLQFLGSTFFGGLGQAASRPIKGTESYLNWITEPSGMGQLGRQIAEARAVGPEQREADELRDYQQISKDRDIANRRILDEARDKAKALPEDKREDYITKLADSGKITEEMSDTLLTEFEDDRLQLTPEEREIKQGSAYGKALYLLDQQKKLTSKEFDAKIDRWEEKGLMGDDVYTQMDVIEEEREQAKPFPGEGVSTAGVGLSLLIPAAAAKTNPVDLSNNPGALMDRSNNLLKFGTAEDGLAAHYDYLQRALTGEHSAYDPNAGLLQFFSVYAPKGHGRNDPQAYARFVASRLGVTVATKVSSLQPRILELMNAIEDMEGWHGPRLSRTPTGGSAANPIVERMTSRPWVRRNP